MAPEILETEILRMARLNNAGDDRVNPIFSGCWFRVTYHKHLSTETMLKCWVTSGNVVFSDLTARVVDDEDLLYVDVVAGTDMESDTVAVLNKIHFTTTNGHSKVGIWVASAPANMITMDGYSATDALAPAIFKVT